ncbi:hypothetical protein D3C87_1384940 [compost metagenome]
MSWMALMAWVMTASPRRSAASANTASWSASRRLASSCAMNTPIPTGNSVARVARAIVNARNQLRCIGEHPLLENRAERGAPKDAPPPMMCRIVNARLIGRPSARPWGA